MDSDVAGSSNPGPDEGDRPPGRGSENPGAPGTDPGEGSSNPGPAEDGGRTREHDRGVHEGGSGNPGPED